MKYFILFLGEIAEMVTKIHTFLCNINEINFIILWIITEGVVVFNAAPG